MGRLTNLALIAALVYALYECDCRMRKKSNSSHDILKVTPPVVVFPEEPDVERFAPHGYTDPELLAINQKQMKPIIPEAKLQPSDDQVLDKHLLDVNDYRFDHCGEVQNRDPVTEGKQYELPLGLMCRQQYRRAINVKRDPNFLERGFKGCA